MSNESYSVVTASRLPKTRPSEKWLIEKLWSAEAVGLIGGPPKSCKSWLALEMAYSVASGQPCLGAFPVFNPGPVLVYSAEDALPAVHERLSCLANSRGLSLAEAPLSLIQASRIRLDLVEDRKRLACTIDAHRPRLLLLDPLVRLHHCDENSASELAFILAYLRKLQRAYGASVLITHHARKIAVSGVPLGSALRGSSDLWAWGDSNLYLQPTGRQIQLVLEHRAACAPAKPIYLRLVDQDSERVHLQMLGVRTIQTQRHKSPNPQQSPLGPSTNAPAQGAPNYPPPSPTTDRSRAPKSRQDPSVTMALHKDSASRPQDSLPREQPDCLFTLHA